MQADESRSPTGTCLQVLAVALTVSCGGGGGGSAAAGTAPTIANLQYWPRAAYASTTPTSFVGTIAFSDPDGDLASATLTIRSSSGTAVGTTTVPIQGAAGVTSGMLQGAVTAALPVADDYTLEVFVTDASGLRSNVLDGTVRVTPFPWTARQAGPTAREYAAVAVLDGRLYVVGGQRTDTGTIPGPVTSVVEVYDPHADSWTTAPPMPTARMGLVVGVVGGKLYAVGGAIDGWGTAVGTVEEYDPVAQAWAPRASMPTARCFAGGAQIGGRIVVVGGRDVVVDSMSVAEAYDPSTNAWSSVAALPTARRELAVVENAGRLYAAGGYAGLVPQWVGTLESYDPTTNSWSSRAPMPTARSHLALVTVGGKVLAAGGENVHRAVDTLESYDTSTDSWSTMTSSPAAFSRAAAGVVDGKAYVFGSGLALEYEPANEIR